MAKSSKKPGAGWFSRIQMRELFGVSEQVFDRRYRPLAPQGAELKDDHGHVWFQGRPLLDAWLAREKQLAAESDPLADGDALLSGKADKFSPALERYRAAKARLAELDLAEREGQSIPRRHVHEAFMSIASILRQLGGAYERSRKMTGRDAHEQLEEALDECTRLMEQAFGSNGDTDFNH